MYQLTPVHDAVGHEATTEMQALHSVFRRELGRAGALVRAAEGREGAYVARIDHHLSFVERFLHHHHTLEDERLWPALLDRAPAEIAPVVELMESQHGVVDECLQRAQQLRSSWRGQPTVAGSSALADLYDRLHAALVEHLDAEESRVMPIVERVVSRAEWTELGKAGQAAFPGREGLLVFGMIQRDAGDVVVASMLAAAPAPVRFLLPRLARRAYDGHVSRLGLEPRH